MRYQRLGQQDTAFYIIMIFFLQGLVSIELTTSAAFVTWAIWADTAMKLSPRVAMTLVILGFPAWIKQCLFLVVRVHLVLQATGKAAKVTVILGSWNTLIWIEEDEISQTCIMTMFWHTLTTDIQAPCSCCLKFCLFWVEGSPRASFLHYCMQFWALMQATVKRLPKAPKCTDIGRALTCIDNALIGGDSREHRRLIKEGRIHERTSLHKQIRQTEQHGLGNLILLWLQLNSFDWIPHITFLIRLGCIWLGCIWLTLKPNKLQNDNWSWHGCKIPHLPIAVITAEPADKFSFVYNCMHTRLRGQYNGKWLISLAYVSRPLVTVITAINDALQVHFPGFDNQVLSFSLPVLWLSSLIRTWNLILIELISDISQFPILLV